MTEAIKALEHACTCAGSQIGLARHLNVAQSSVWTWLNQRKGASYRVVAQLVGVTRGERTADEFRPDMYGWLGRLNDYLAEQAPEDVTIAGAYLLWHQTPELEAVKTLMKARGWSRERARAAVDYITDNDLHWLGNTDQDAAARTEGAA